MLRVPGRRGAVTPLTCDPGIFKSPDCISSRIAQRRSAFSFLSLIASANAAAAPTIPATFSVPARWPRSCSPPSIYVSGAHPRRAYIIPTPFGPWNLCADIDKRSMFICFTSIGNIPAACTASQWNSTPSERHMLPISATGWIVPSSLFASITDTSAVSGRIAAATSSARTRPLLSALTYVTSKPSRSRALALFKTAWCSILSVTICFFPLPASRCAVPFIAQLSLSVPPEVKYISAGSAFMPFAKTPRAFSTALCALRPSLYRVEALPYSLSIKGFIASNAASDKRVVAALSA